jgi:hypothetical protein
MNFAEWLRLRKPRRKEINPPRFPSRNWWRRLLSGGIHAGAWLREADLTGADLTGANLSHTRYDAGTQWPLGYDPQAHGAVLVASDDRTNPSGNL